MTLVPGSHDDIFLMREAIKQAELSAREQRRDPNHPPAVGAVVVDPHGALLATAFRSETSPNDHAEYIALEEKLKGKKIPGAILYTTLEPCMDVRSPDKTDCAILVAKSGVSEVVVGMMDPDVRVCAKGWLHLAHNNIRLRRFPDPLERQIRLMNRKFIERVSLARLTRAAHGARRVSKKRGPVLGFVDDLRPDLVDVLGLAKHYLRRTPVPEIRWPQANEELWFRGLRERAAIVERYRLGTPGGGDPTEAEEAFLWVDRILDFAWRVRVQAALRIPKMWRGMLNYWGKPTPVKEDAFICALSNFLGLCNFEILLALYDIQRRETEDILPKGVAGYKVRACAGKPPAERCSELFGWNAYGSAEIFEMGENYVGFSVAAPLDDLVSIWGKHGIDAIDDFPGIYSNYFVPQVECGLVGKDEIVEYEDMRWKCIKDAGGYEIKD